MGTLYIAFSLVRFGLILILSKEVGYYFYLKRTKVAFLAKIGVGIIAAANAIFLGYELTHRLSILKDYGGTAVIPGMGVTILCWLGGLIWGQTKHREDLSQTITNSPEVRRLLSLVEQDIKQVLQQPYI